MSKSVSQNYKEYALNAIFSSVSGFISGVISYVYLLVYDGWSEKSVKFVEASFGAIPGGWFLAFIFPILLIPACWFSFLRKPAVVFWDGLIFASSLAIGLSGMLGFFHPESISGDFWMLWVLFTAGVIFVFTLALPYILHRSIYGDDINDKVITTVIACITLIVSLIVGIVN